LQDLDELHAEMESSKGNIWVGKNIMKQVVGHEDKYDQEFEGVCFEHPGCQCIVSVERKRKSEND
jgi:hypothetical protein